jgi:7-dehydrocholesterol reductase
MEKPAIHSYCVPVGPLPTENWREFETYRLDLGWWGISRHANYLGDLLFNFAICATCGFEKILPWTFFFWMVFFLIHRMQRVEQSCQRKYGDGWKKYCEQVRYRLIPGIY